VGGEGTTSIDSRWGGLWGSCEKHVGGSVRGSCEDQPVRQLLIGDIVYLYRGGRWRRGQVLRVRTRKGREQVLVKLDSLPLSEGTWRTRADVATADEVFQETGRTVPTVAGSQGTSGSRARS
jgi:hypothetical protein